MALSPYAFGFPPDITLHVLEHSSIARATAGIDKPTALVPENVVLAIGDIERKIVLLAQIFKLPTPYTTIHGYGLALSLACPTESYTYYRR